MGQVQKQKTRIDAVQRYARRRPITQDAAFTLIELLVAVFIIVLITLLVLPNWQSGERSLALDRAIHKTAQDARRTQELSLRGEPYTCTPPGKMHAYGIFFDEAIPASYLIFAECDESSIGYNIGTDGVVEIIQLENGIEIQSVSPSPKVSIVFVPPVPMVYIEPGSQEQALITFQRIDGQEQRVLTITRKGLVDID